MIKNLPAKVGDARDRFDSWVGRIPWRRKWQPALGFLLENPVDRGAWRATVCVVSENQTRLSTEHTRQKVTQHCKATPLQYSCLSVRRHTDGRQERRQGQGGPRARQEPAVGVGVRPVGAEAVSVWPPQLAGVQ